MGSLFDPPKIDTSAQQRALEAQRKRDEEEAKEREQKRQAALNALSGGEAGVRRLLFAGRGGVGGTRSLLS